MCVIDGLTADDVESLAESIDELMFDSAVTSEQFTRRLNELYKLVDILADRGKLEAHVAMTLQVAASLLFLETELMMLVLSRHQNESIMIGDQVKVVVVSIRGDKVRLGIEAPKTVPVHRQEIYDAIKDNEDDDLRKKHDS